MSAKLKLSQAIEGMLFYKRAAGKSPNTIGNYRIQLEKLKTFFSDDPLFASITRDQLVDFFAWLNDGYVSGNKGHIPRPAGKLSQQSLYTIHSHLSVLWSWGVEEGLVAKNIVRTIKIDKPDPPAIETFTREEIQALLKACDKSAAGRTRPTADRDRAIILLLLDTGVRATELCTIKVGDLNIQTNSVKIVGKGSKERVVYFGRRAAKAIWRHLMPRLSISDPQDYLFLIGSEDDPGQMTRSNLRLLLKRIGERAGVPNVFPHRFRHTFAITYMRNQGDMLTLQALLGHSDLEMVRRYTRVGTLGTHSNTQKCFLICYRSILCYFGLFRDFLAGPLVGLALIGYLAVHQAAH
jgi:integrase/recombinase XerD